ncbi:MAG: 2-C-methyl-D-erythritol 4-phosphate cytidylyltransferase [Opitutaceae bacterium]|nr:2-C-methyl-D-erythritol 4-phosphate cytidylyltransferase [Cytophagales bacterium]
MKRYALIVAAGTGSRMNAGLPKQFIILAGKPVLFYSLSAFYSYDPLLEIILVLSGNEIARWKGLSAEFNISIPHTIVAGGATRTESVRKGLDLVSEGLVAIHDGARPLVSIEIIDNCFKSALSSGSGVACVQPKDSVRLVEGDSNKALNRDDYRLMQTPQTFQVELIKKAFEICGNGSSTDDATIFELAGYQVSLVNGDFKNIKITTQEDLTIAESFLK